MGDATENTKPDSFEGMCKAIEKSGATSEAALAWSVKTYNMVLPVVANLQQSQERARVAQRDSRWAMLAAAIAVAASFVGLACGLVR